VPSYRGLARSDKGRRASAALYGCPSLGPHAAWASRLARGRARRAPRGDPRACSRTRRLRPQFRQRVATFVHVTSDNPVVAEGVEVLVIGGGQAGLAMGYYLAERDGAVGVVDEMLDTALDRHAAAGGLHFGPRPCSPTRAGPLHSNVPSAIASRAAARSISSSATTRARSSKASRRAAPSPRSPRAPPGTRLLNASVSFAAIHWKRGETSSFRGDPAAAHRTFPLPVNRR
jgi:hypothetical protein